MAAVLACREEITTYPNLGLRSGAGSWQSPGSSAAHAYLIGSRAQTGYRIRLIGQLVRPARCHLHQRGSAAEFARRNALATSPGFSALLDVRRRGDGPEIDLARWGCVASRRSG